MGIKKVGDRVRIFIAIKQLRNKSGTTSRQKNMVGCVTYTRIFYFMLILDTEYLSCA